MAEKVLVITATKRLISQRFRTTTQMMEKKQEKKDSESIVEYIGAVNCGIRLASAHGPRIGTYTALSRDDRNLECSIEEIVVTLDVLERVISFLEHR
jgi:hypothetical protein